MTFIQYKGPCARDGNAAGFRADYADVNRNKKNQHIQNPQLQRFCCKIHNKLSLQIFTSVGVNRVIPQQIWSVSEIEIDMLWI